MGWGVGFFKTGRIEAVRKREVPPPTGTSVLRLDLNTGRVVQLSAILSEEELRARAAREHLEDTPTKHPGFRVIHPAPFVRQVKEREQIVGSNAEAEKLIEVALKLRDEVLTWPDDLHERIAKTSFAPTLPTLREKIWWKVKGYLNAVRGS